eukprot:10901792-Alexandrium_andersonii.AAC.1
MPACCGGAAVGACRSGMAGACTGAQGRARSRRCNPAARPPRCTTRRVPAKAALAEVQWPA